MIAIGLFSDFISQFDGRQLGAYKRAANLAGLTFEVYSPVDPQPEREIARASDKWLAWQLKQLAESNPLRERQ